MKKSVLLLLGAAFAAGCARRISAGNRPSTPRDSIKANIALVQRFITEVVNGGRTALVDELWADNMTWHGGSQGEVHGRVAYRKMLEASVGGAFTGMHLSIRDVVASGDKVVLYFTNSGRNTGSFMGYPPTGRPASWEGMGIYRIREGRIAEAWFSEDILNMFVQLGLVTLPKR